MAIRLRRIDNGKLIAVCAALTEPKEGDVYLDDEAHYALTMKFAHDHETMDVEEYAGWMEREQGYRDAAAELEAWSLARGGGKLVEFPEAAPAVCANCGGTGKVVLAKSWFMSDGYRKERCPICDGSGRSSFQPDPGSVERQMVLRQRLAAPTPEGEREHG